MTVGGGRSHDLAAEFLLKMRFSSGWSLAADLSNATVRGKFALRALS